jgi:formate dehydrogenase maturation protein FdhE
MKNQPELNKQDCEVCGAKHSIILVVQSTEEHYVVYKQCQVCSSEYSGNTEYLLANSLNKINQLNKEQYD